MRTVMVVLPSRSVQVHLYALLLKIRFGFLVVMFPLLIGSCPACPAIPKVTPSGQGCGGYACNICQRLAACRKKLDICGLSDSIRSAVSSHDSD